jgi:hypothetical protein
MPIVCRAAAQTAEDLARRTVEAIDVFMQGGGSGASFAPFVFESGRSDPLPFPLFSSKWEISACRAKFPFCQVEELTPEGLPKAASGLCFFTYTDFCEMPDFLRVLADRHPSAYCMFIPFLRVKEAFQAMTPIFERQQKRAQFVQQAVSAGSKSPAYTLHRALVTVHFDFITILQGTLTETLGCPIILICPVH